jgi:hypothetical protein
MARSEGLRPDGKAIINAKNRASIRRPRIDHIHEKAARTDTPSAQAGCGRVGYSAACAAARCRAVITYVAIDGEPHGQADPGGGDDEAYRRG